MESIVDFLGTGPHLPVLMIGMPAVFGLVILLAVKKDSLRTAVTLAASVINLALAGEIYFADAEIISRAGMASFGLDLDFLVSEYSALFIFITAGVFAVISFYCSVWLKGREYSGLFMFYLFVSLAMINGAFLCDSLGTMLFFWEGLLCTLFGSLLIGNTKNYKTAVKALTLSGFADLLLMLGIIITVSVAGTSKISAMSSLPVSGTGALGFACLMLGALGKAGCMPFHSWIPSAAKDAPVPFMTAFPGALEKLLGVYLAVRAMKIYDVRPGSPASVAVMLLGAVTLVCAVAMALVQKDMKKLLSYHAISQVGYMVLGIGSALPIGIEGGLFHMLNNAVYKSALFMIAGIIERKLGTTDLRKFSGLGRKMPITMLCFTVCGLSIAGVPPFNGFFSKELIFDAALEAPCRLNGFFYACALVGAFMTAVSFLKMGRAAFSGKTVSAPGAKGVNEKGLGLKLPVCIMAAMCIFLGVFNKLPVDAAFGSAIGAQESHGGWPNSAVLVIVSMLVLALALADHAYGCRKTGKPINAADHIHYAPGLKGIFKIAEAGRLDPFNWLTALMNGFSFVCEKIERLVSFIYDTAVPKAVVGIGELLHNADNGALSRYIAGVVIGVIVILIVFASYFIG